MRCGWKMRRLCAIPERIDVLARRIGLVPPEPGQVIRMDSATADPQAPVMASAMPVAVIPGR